jgi:hypothetical protein
LARDRFQAFDDSAVPEKPESDISIADVDG